MKKVSIGSWAFTGENFADHPIDLQEVIEKLHEMKFDGISMGGFMPHANPDLYETPEKRAALLQLLKDNELEVADYAADLWSVDSLQQSEEWIALFEKACIFCDQMGWPVIRVDTGTPPVVPEGMTYAECRAKIVDNFKKIAQFAQKYNKEVVWEFEPGFMINEPKYILETYEAVNEPNFSVLVDTCHAYMSAVMGARHIEENRLEGGVVELINMLSGKIGFVHVIDSDGTLNVTATSTHAPFGLGKIDFDEVIPALIDAGGFKGEWWAIDLCEWPDAWNAIRECKDFVDAFNQKYCG
ncbi:MAG: sugar phosphate isomerase/epimerase [Eubacterium sp.]|nr:sugar phosphate isomerase/epimerase [Eubacterium sp.]